MRVQNGSTLTTDGPFADTKEVFGGYYVFDAGNLDEALELAARVPPRGSAARSRSARWSERLQPLRVGASVRSGMSGAASSRS